MTDTGYQLSGEEPAKPGIDAVCAFVVVQLPTGQWTALLGEKAGVQINPARDSTPEDLIPACSAINADALAGKTAQASMNLQMMVAQQVQASKNNEALRKTLKL